jgi:translocation and assembly module TamB
VGSWDGAASDAPPASLWMQARDLKAELLFGGGGQLLWLQADPGRVQLGDNVTLRWDEVQADWRAAQPLLQLRADIDPFALAPLLARWQPQMGWAGDIRLGARVDIRAGQRFDADLVFERRDGDLHISSGEGMQLLGLTDLKFSLSAHDGVWLFNPVFKGRSLGEITGSARIQTTPQARWPDSNATLQGEVQARVADIGIWGAWVPPGWRMAGELRTKATLGGRFGEPRYTGDLSGTGLSVRNLLQGVNVTDGQVTVRLEGDKATIDRFTLRGGDGLLSVTGGATLGTSPEAQLQIKADRFRAIGRVDRTVTASGQTELTIGRDRARLEGRVVLDEGVFDFSRADAPSLDEDVTVRRPGDTDPTLADPRQAGPRSNLVVGLDLDLGQALRLRGRGVDTKLRGKLRLSNPGGRWDARGTIQAVEGTYAAYGQKLTVERGLVAFGGPVDDPRLDILALRPNIDTRVGVAITGTAQTPRIRLFSEPDMSDTEKLSWLVLGRAPDGLGRTDTALLQRAAVALLAGEGEAPTDTLLKSLGIDEIGLKQSDGDVRETVITLGKQLSRRWYVGYERGVNSTIGTWQLIYRIAQRFTVRAQSGLENSLDVIWTWRFQETPADAAMRKSTVTPP